MKSWRAATLIGIALAVNGCARPGRASVTQPVGERVVSAPSRIAFVSSDRAASGLSGEIRFGGARGRSALYLKFPSDFRARGIPQRAYLTLSARAGSASADAPVTLEAWRISADWQPRTLQHWSDKPSLALPYTRTRITSSPTQDLRIDITELVRFAARNPERDFGIAVIASGSEGPGASFSTGLAGGRAPRLELYLR
ncbi:MAG: DNRLRE domain-containing protein [Pseudomonadota bacterium]